MSTREIEKLLGHSLDDDQLDRDFSLERAQRADLGLHWSGDEALFLSWGKPVAEGSPLADREPGEPPSYEI